MTEVYYAELFMKIIGSSFCSMALLASVAAFLMMLDTDINIIRIFIILMSIFGIIMIIAILCRIWLGVFF